jgi:prolyl-tRNA editing enzyme YbaK/EbsC (Cys-tRNA(Pro) deacylase)
MCSVPACGPAAVVETFTRPLSRHGRVTDMTDVMTLGTLAAEPVRDRMDLVAVPVAQALAGWPPADRVAVAPIDPELADTAAFCAAYDVPASASANCVVVCGKRSGEQRWAAAVILATTRADVNGALRRRLDVRKLSFASMADAVTVTGMEYGGITPIGVPDGWPVLVDAAVAAAGPVVIGSGIRGSKIVLDGALLADLAGAEVIEGLANPM